MFDIGKIQKTPHLLADVAELALLFQGLAEVSKSDLGEIVAQAARDAEETEEEIHPDESTAEAKAISQTKLDDCFLQLQYRAKTFGGCYPFNLKGGVLVFPGSLSPASRIYAFLLICSRIRSFKKNLWNGLASSFEVVSKEALRKMMPEDAEVRLFAVDSEDRKTYFGTHFHDAVKTLASDLGDTPQEKSIAKEPAQGDGGLDVIGLVPFRDGASGAFAVFGQSAAREIYWPKKVLEAHPLNFNSLINFTHPPVNMVFIPLCYRDSNGEWVSTKSVSQSVLLDRVRLCKLLDDWHLPRNEQDLLDNLLPHLSPSS